VGHSLDFHLPRRVTISASTRSTNSWIPPDWKFPERSLVRRQSSTSSMQTTLPGSPASTRPFSLMAPEPDLFAAEKVGEQMAKPSGSMESARTILRGKKLATTRNSIETSRHRFRSTPNMAALRSPSLEEREASDTDRGSDIPPMPFIESATTSVAPSRSHSIRSPSRTSLYSLDSVSHRSETWERPRYIMIEPLMENPEDSDGDWPISSSSKHSQAGISKSTVRRLRSNAGLGSTESFTKRTERVVSSSEGLPLKDFQEFDFAYPSGNNRSTDNFGVITVVSAGSPDPGPLMHKKKSRNSLFWASSNDLSAGMAGESSGHRTNSPTRKGLTKRWLGKMRPSKT
jgi:hypothetical protein